MYHIGLELEAVVNTYNFTIALNDINYFKTFSERNIFSWNVLSNTKPRLHLERPLYGSNFYDDMHQTMKCIISWN